MNTYYQGELKRKKKKKQNKMIDIYADFNALGIGSIKQAMRV
jgi:hypothetical protein